MSVGSKPLSRAVASWLSKWSDTGLHESRSGFRASRGTDDDLQLTHLIKWDKRLQQMVSSSRVYIEKVYPRVCWEGLWQMLARHAGPIVCATRRMRTAYRVRHLGGMCSDRV